MSTLSAFELRKYEWRIPTFLERLASGTFLTTSNTEVRLTFTEDFLAEQLQHEPAKVVNKLQFFSEDGTAFTLKDLLKDSGFGGVSPLKREQQALALLNQRLEIEKYNYASDSIPIVIAGNCYIISGAASTIGTPKSDFHLLGPQGEELVWISHKHGKSPRCFQQWGGVSAKCEPNIFNHPETQEFAADLSRFDIGPGRTIAKAIEDSFLRNLAVYGNGFGEAYGRNNVQLVIQGDPGISSNTGNAHFDVVGHSVHANGEELPPEYAPTFMAMYRGDRNDLGISKCRVGISPAKARLISNWIYNNDESIEPHHAPGRLAIHTACTPDPGDLEGSERRNPPEDSSEPDRQV